MNEARKTQPSIYPPQQEEKVDHSPWPHKDSKKKQEDNSCEVVDISKHRISFPWKLHVLLHDVQEEGDNRIVSWLPHGKAFAVYDRKAFVKKVLPTYFRQSTYRSFQRQLYFYGFKLVDTGPEEGAYYHPLFIRGERDLTFKIKKLSNPSDSSSVVNVDRAGTRNSPPIGACPVSQPTNLGKESPELEARSSQSEYSIPFADTDNTTSVACLEVPNRNVTMSPNMQSPFAQLESAPAWAGKSLIQTAGSHKVDNKHPRGQNNSPNNGVQIQKNNDEAFSAESSLVKPELVHLNNFSPIANLQRGPLLNSLYYLPQQTQEEQQDMASAHQQLTMQYQWNTDYNLMAVSRTPVMDTNLGLQTFVTQQDQQRYISAPVSSPFTANNPNTFSPSLQVPTNSSHAQVMNNQVEMLSIPSTRSSSVSAHQQRFKSDQSSSSSGDSADWITALEPRPFPPSSRPL